MRGGEREYDNAIQVKVVCIHLLTKIEWTSWMMMIKSIYILTLDILELSIRDGYWTISGPVVSYIKNTQSLSLKNDSQSMALKSYISEISFSFLEPAWAVADVSILVRKITTKHAPPYELLVPSQRRRRLDECNFVTRIYYSLYRRVF